MRSQTDFNDDWIFQGTERVRLPHTAVELPLTYFDETAYQRPFSYSKSFVADPAWAGREVHVVFDGAMANAKVAVNGAPVLAHADGYTPFAVRLTDRLVAGSNTIDVSIDGSENPAIPPFGNLIDYLTYAGIYRDVWLRVTAPVAIDSVKIETPDPLAECKRVTLAVTLANPRALPLGGTLTATLRDADGLALAATTVELVDAGLQLEIADLAGIALWDIDNPALYTMELALETPYGTDTLSTRFGFRAAEFTRDGFRLNGRPIKLRGLNRHQSFPYSGYALGRAAQRRDADILRHQLKLNMVRTSHYPQSTWFLERCDELGLLVFEEIPGWQHIGDAAWKQESVENVRRMIRRDWNHPSIVIWGVRINESRDDHDFYVETNRAARELDSTRAIGGVRCYTDSELLEDVYTMNDFILGLDELGGNRPRTPLRPQQEVTGLDRQVPYLVTEFNGHMYPTKRGDQEQRQIEHVTRHLQVLNAAYGDPQVSGAIGWCAFDYNTHKDFGSGDRICHHGVMDIFREPKLAAFAYASQCDPAEEIILKPVTIWANGERNIGGVLPLMVLTNCDEVELRYGNQPPKRVGPDRDAYPHLPHAPAVFDRRHFSDGELGIWGDGWVDGVISGFIGGKKVAEARLVADPVATSLAVVPDASEIGARDSVRLMVRALDQVGNVLAHYAEPVSITVSGPGRRLGPGLVSLRAGAIGFWVQAEAAGPIIVTVTSERLGKVSVVLQAS
ncbi:glycoside hydrolase family 2 TIM barrel-domain containing protein [Devosia sp. FKR38]|uniref:glycoside hydrolase family 2 protein n=1 Tax=Devosia sp. FKR38 TaxID=2562312 RepID=UPI0010C14330|nr:glycoside hydrolase family 2 TIM barrel-domain containing protein [Devosia sp. FKR38]